MIFVKKKCFILTFKVGYAFFAGEKAPSYMFDRVLRTPLNMSYIEAKYRFRFNIHVTIHLQIFDI